MAPTPANQNRPRVQASLYREQLATLESHVAATTTALMALPDETFAAEREAVIREASSSPSNLAAHMLLDVYEIVASSRQPLPPRVGKCPSDLNDEIPH